MNQDFLAVLEYMEKEKGISRKVMMDAIQSALVSACRKALGTTQDVRIEMDAKTNKISAFAKLKVVEKIKSPSEEVTLPRARQVNLQAKLGDMVEVEVTPKDFGRIAAQVFKQTINQNIRSIERTMIFDEFKDRVGDIVTGVVRRFDRSDVIIDLGKFEGIIPARERVSTEEYTVGERVRALVLAVENTTRGPEIVLSRSHPNFVRRLLELEVSELHDKAVEIKGLAREAGYRTKIAVWSNDEKIDPVGACVGIRGARVKNIVRELNNEKIDLFRWSPNISELVIEALKPAKLKKIETDQKGKRVKVIVDDENLSLAIGRRGQNARLASRVIGWEIDVEKEKVEGVGFEQKLDHAIQQLVEVLKIDRDAARAIATAGFASIEGIIAAEEADLLEALPDMDPELVKKIHAAAVATQQSTNAT
ncbi:MAG: transcription termination factor NusA [Verrucomicrobiota bacterium]